jgi:1-deoxy-D-xylulose-5-phosphate reductoisomerase
MLIGGKMINITVLGSTGSIGKQTLDIIRNNKDIFRVVALTANSNIKLLIEQIEEFKPDLAVIGDINKYSELKRLCSNKTEALSGEEGIVKAAIYEKADLVVSAIVGIAALMPTYSAIAKGKRIALANKETLVTAGSLIMKEAAKNNVRIIPVDSEHSAIFQCMERENNQVFKMILTASGGPFWNKTQEEFAKVTIAEALNHPNWVMGKKITIDSATMMNKGLEVIEANRLFDISPDKIEVVIHPQSIIHSMVEYIDGSVIAQLGIPDMRLPIQYAMTYPARKSTLNKRLRLSEVKNLSFYEPDFEKFPCLRLAYEALKLGDSACIVLNGTNEIAVKSFLEGRIKFTDIYKLIYLVMEKHNNIKIDTIEDVLAIDDWSRKKGEELLKRGEF